MIITKSTFNTVIILLLCIFFPSCEKEKSLKFDLNIHRGTAISQYGDTLGLSASFLKEPEDWTGMSRISLYVYESSNPLHRNEALSITIRTNQFSNGCTVLEMIDPLYEADATYPNAMATQKDGHQNLGFLYLRSDRESTICLTDFSPGDPEMEGNFDLHFYKLAPSFPHLDTVWSDSLSMSGYFRAFGREQN